MAPARRRGGLLREVLSASRLLRVTGIATLLTLAILGVETMLGWVHPGVAGILVLLDGAVWYFGLTMAAGFGDYRAFQPEDAGRRRLHAFALRAAEFCIILVQALLIGIVTSLWQRS